MKGTSTLETDTAKLRASVEMAKVGIASANTEMLYAMLMKVIEAKQKEVLFRYLFIPFWTSLIITLVVLALLLVFFQALYLLSGFVFFIAFSIYARGRFCRRLKEIRKGLLTLLDLKSAE